MRHDFDAIPDGAAIILHPADANMLHRKPVRATRQGFYFYCEGTDPVDGPDYSMRDVSAFCEGWEAVEVAA